jgi:hypothetical protein
MIVAERDPEVPNASDEQEDEEARILARRKLLTAGAYLTPAVLATLIADKALAQTRSCQPTYCNPCCMPGGGTCNPPKC